MWCYLDSIEGNPSPLSTSSSYHILNVSIPYTKTFSQRDQVIGGAPLKNFKNKKMQIFISFDIYLIPICNFHNLKFFE